MKTEHRPNAYWMRGAMPSLEKSRDEYIGSVYGAAALGYITAIHTADALDSLQERCPQLIRGRLKYHFNNIGGRDGDPGHLARLYRAIDGLLRNRGDRAWMADFGNAANEAVEPHVLRLRMAVANALGRYPLVPDINVCAAVVVAQSLAHEATAYVRRRSERLGGYTITMADGCRRTVPQLLATVSCAPTDHSLREIAQALLERCLPKDTDLLADPTVKLGCRAVLNCMASPETWIFARDKAERLNMKDE